MEKLKKVKNDLSKQKNYHENKLICSKYFATNVIKGTLDQAQDFELALEYGWVLKKFPFILVIKVKWGQMKFSNMQKSSIQLLTSDYVRLLNRPYGNEVTSN